jgi:hypothetical protein
VTGAVKTQGQTYFGDFKLPDDSLYSSIEDIIASRAQGKDGVDRMPLMAYSNKVVDQITKGVMGKFWCGNSASGTKFGSSYLPAFVMVGSRFMTYRYEPQGLANNLLFIITGQGCRQGYWAG